MQYLTLIQSISVWIVPVLLAITLHEAAHAWVACRCGDYTAKLLGRLSANPFRHIDFIGTIIVPLVIAVLSNFQFVFGWAKPVPINWNKLRNPQRDMALVGVAGPMSNFAMTLIWAAILKLGMLLNPGSSVIALYMVLTGQAGIMVNLILAFLNLLPIPPLDGSRVLAPLLPAKLGILYSRIEPFGFFIILALLLTNVLGWILGPLVFGMFKLIAILFSL